MSRPNAYEAQQETKERAHRNAISELTASRNRLKNALSEVEGFEVPPKRVLVNPHPPTPEDVSGGFADPHWADKLRLCHAAAVEFAREVSAYKKHAQSHWQEELGTVSVPEIEGHAIVNRPHQHNDFRQSELVYTDVELALSKMDQWRFREIVLWCEYEKRWEGTVARSRREKVLLSPVACDLIYTQLNEILDELSLLAEIREPSATAADPGKPDDLDAWRQYEDGE